MRIENRSARWLTMLLFLLAVVMVIGAIAVAGDQNTKQGAQGAFTEAVYSCAQQETNSAGQMVYVAPDRIPDGLYTYDVTTKAFIGGAGSLPRVDSLPIGPDGIGVDLPAGGRPGWYFRSAPLCNRDASAGTTDSLWLSTFTVDPLQTPESMPVSFSPPFRAGARGPQGPQGLYPIYVYAQAGTGTTVPRSSLPTQWDIDLTTGEISNLEPTEWLPNPFQVSPNAVLWTSFTIVNPAQWPGLAQIDETYTEGSNGVQSRFWSTPIQWSGTPGTAGAPGRSGIQGVTAGTGLSGGGSGGVVTLDIETPYTPDEQNKLANIEDEATRVEANPTIGTNQVPSTNLNLLEVSGQYYSVPKGDQGKQGRYRVEIYGEAPANSPPTAPIGGQVNVQTAQITAPPDTANEILGSAWSVELFPLADPVNNVLWISTYWVNPQFQSGVLTPSWSTPVVSGELGPQGLQGEVGLSVQPMFLEAATQPTKPDIAYASNHTFTSTPNGWNVNPPPTPTDPIWLILVRHQAGVFTASIDPNLITTPIRVSGTDGQEGDSGWTPAFAIVADGERRVLQITSWTGGTGTAPTSGSYIGSSGLVSLLADAIDLRGPAGSGGGSGGSSSFIGLSDTPAVFGTTGEVLKVDASGTALVFASEGGGATTILDLTDTPASFGTSGQVLKVNTAGTGMVFADESGGSGGSSTFVGLTDTPGSFGTAGQILSVNTNGNGLVFINAPTGGGQDGTDGTDGIDGQTSWFQFSADNSSWHNTPQSGDRYLRYALGITRPANSTSDWSAGVEFKGADGAAGSPGAQGEQGIQGPAGIDGAPGTDGHSPAFSSGNTFPSNPTSNDVHLFRQDVASGLTWFDTDGNTALSSAAIGDVARFNGTAWVKQGNIRGEQGEAGHSPVFTSGDAFPSNPTANDFHLFRQDVASGVLWFETNPLADSFAVLTSALAGDIGRYSGRFWLRVANIAGPAGTDGTDGQTSWFQFSSDNSSWHNTPQSGDRYLRYALGLTRPVDTSSDWSAGVEFRGATGEGNGREILLDELDDATGRNVKTARTSFASEGTIHQNQFSFRPITESDIGKDIIWYGKYSAVAGQGVAHEDRIWHLRIPVALYLEMGLVTPSSTDRLNNVFSANISRPGVNILNRNEESRLLVARIPQETVDGETYDRIAVSISGRLDAHGEPFHLEAFKTAIILR